MKINEELSVKDCLTFLEGARNGKGKHPHTGRRMAKDGPQFRSVFRKCADLGEWDKCNALKRFPSYNPNSGLRFRENSKLIDKWAKLCSPKAKKMACPEEMYFRDSYDHKSKSGNVKRVHSKCVKKPVKKSKSPSSAKLSLFVSRNGVSVRQSPRRSMSPRRSPMVMAKKPKAKKVVKSPSSRSNISVIRSFIKQDKIAGMKKEAKKLSKAECDEKLFHWVKSYIRKDGKKVKGHCRVRV